MTDPKSSVAPRQPEWPLDVLRKLKAGHANCGSADCCLSLEWLDLALAAHPPAHAQPANAAELEALRLAESLIESARQLAVHNQNRSSEKAFEKGLVEIRAAVLLAERAALASAGAPLIGAPEARPDEVLKLPMIPASWLQYATHQVSICPACHREVGPWDLADHGDGWNECPFAVALEKTATTDEIEAEDAPEPEKPSPAAAASPGDALRAEALGALRALLADHLAGGACACRVCGPARSVLGKADERG